MASTPAGARRSAIDRRLGYAAGAMMGLAGLLFVASVHYESFQLGGAEVPTVLLGVVLLVPAGLVDVERRRRAGQSRLVAAGAMWTLGFAAMGVGFATGFAPILLLGGIASVASGVVYLATALGFVASDPAA